jgi:hypothetical protein
VLFSSSLLLDFLNEEKYTKNTIRSKKKKEEETNRPKVRTKKKVLINIYKQIQNPNRSGKKNNLNNLLLLLVVTCIGEGKKTKVTYLHKNK